MVFVLFILRRLYPVINDERVIQECDYKGVDQLSFHYLVHLITTNLHSLHFHQLYYYDKTGHSRHYKSKLPERILVIPGLSVDLLEETFVSCGVLAPRVFLRNSLQDFRDVKTGPNEDETEAELGKGKDLR